MKQKKIFSALLCSTLALFLTSCSSQDLHAGHTVSNEWDRDAKEHWQLCECEEEVNRTAHTLDDASVCTICGSEVWSFDDGSADVSNYDENYNLLRSTSYDADGDVTYDMTQTYTYDEAGNLTTLSTFENGILSGETAYAPGSDGLWYEAKYTGYYEDGSQIVNEYDETGNILVLLSYDADGILVYESHYEYAAGIDGETYTSKITSHFDDGTSGVSEYNEYNDLVLEATYDTDGNIVTQTQYTYTYDDQGRKLTEQRYQNGTLTQELQYVIHEEEDGWSSYPETATEYFEDGGKHVIFCDADGNETVTIYDSDGNVIE